MAKSGDDLMRWQNIARAESGGAAGRKHTLSISQNVLEIPTCLEYHLETVE